MQTAAWAGLVTKRNLRVEANFDEILEDYFKTNLPDVGGTYINILSNVC